MKLIEKLILPKKLLLIWQVREKDSNERARFIVGEIICNGDRVELKYYNSSAVKKARKKGFNGLTAYPYDTDKKFNGNLVDVLSRRLPPSSRGDYKEYLKSHRISSTATDITPLSLLAYTSGKLEGDGFSFVHTFEGAEAPFDFTFEIAGFRHHKGMDIEPITSLQDKVILLKTETDNQYDKDAIAVISEDDERLGYVPRGLNSVLKQLMVTYKVTAFITKINGTRQRPSILVYVEVK